MKYWFRSHVVEWIAGQLLKTIIRKDRAPRPIEITLSINQGGSNIQASAFLEKLNALIMTYTAQNPIHDHQHFRIGNP
jgi:hypothetical protein